MNSYRILIFLFILMMSYSCSKTSETTNSNSSGTTNNSTELSGEWQSTQIEYKYYTANGSSLLKDSTNVFANDFDANNEAWLETYGNNGKWFTTSLPYTKVGSNVTLVDTEATAVYKLSGQVITYTDNDSGQIITDNIVSISASAMELSSTYIGIPLNSTFGLDMNTTYKLVFYTKYLK